MLPWYVPTPVRPSSFVSVYRRHDYCNVECDLGRIRAFDAVMSARHDPVAYADLQSNPDGQGRGRLGSGRAALFRGHYLKGIGRTALAGNWNSTADVDHHTGHLLASGGIREFLVSKAYQQ